MPFFINIASFTFLYTLLLCLFSQEAEASAPRDTISAIICSDERAHFNYRDEDENGEKKAALRTISGSPYPGVIDHLLQKPLPDDANNPHLADIHINYPSIGNKVIDADIRGWVNDIAEAFESHLDFAASHEQTPGADLDLEIDKFLQDDDLNSGYLVASEPAKVELWGNYKVTRPSNAAVSITFELWNYTASEQGNLDIITLNYSLNTGQRLNLVDIFENPDLALQLMSSWSRDKLQQRLGATMRAQMLKDGTEPLIENFSSLTLTPGGICINFQPYQVAPWDAGIQKVDMPLDALLSSAPLLALWGK